MDLDKLIWKAKAGQILTERELKLLCRRVVDILMEESNVQMVPAPVSICGDIHGQHQDLLKLFETGGEIPDTRYIFMGDFVDRGHNSVETLTLLLCLKARYPDCITLLRGNHESRQVTTCYGFWEEVQRKYGNAAPWTWCTEVFDCMALAAVVDQKVFCVHGGLSPDICTLDHIRLILRLREIPNEGSFCDLMWSDPGDGVDGWSVSPRGAGYLFGPKIAAEWCLVNKLELVCRAHQLVQEGFKYHFPEENCVTVWSAPNYCYRCGNTAAILELDDKMNRNFRTFSEVQPQHSPDAQKATYFL
eukprot:Hpha_TRINITY_DN15329_c2_g2::TRINITY_DN15329_c2_g2_i1::g.89434::m.89434/K15498/PPP6C; serine/threonine-protein phosphatase 6 catalytic subunit